MACPFCCNDRSYAGAAERASDDRFFGGCAGLVVGGLVGFALMMGIVKLLALLLTPRSDASVAVLLFIPLATAIAGCRTGVRRPGPAIALGAVLFVSVFVGQMIWAMCRK